MTSKDKFILLVLSGARDKNIPFESLCSLLNSLGFALRIQGDHHIFSKENIPDILNLQPKQGKAKAYQVKQVRELILKHKLGIGFDD